MFFIHAYLLLHLFNKINRETFNTGYVGSYSKIVFDNRKMRMFYKTSEDYPDTLALYLADSGYITHKYFREQISDIHLTYKGQHWVLFLVRAFCKSVALPIVISFATALLTIILL